MGQGQPAHRGKEKMAQEPGPQRARSESALPSNRGGLRGGASSRTLPSPPRGPEVTLGAVRRSYTVVLEALEALAARMRGAAAGE